MSGYDTLKLAKWWRKAYIEQWQTGDKRHRGWANLLAHCRKGSRCNLVECPVCEYRKERAFSRIADASATKSLLSSGVLVVDVTGVEIIGKRRPLNEEKVKFIAASMREIGQESPIIVRLVGKKIVLVCGLYRLAAAKLLGWDSIICYYMNGDKTDARLWQISENLHRVDLRVLERADLIEDWRRLILKRAKGGQVAPPGGRQPKDTGINKTAKELGLTKEEVRRLKAIGGISWKAKAAAIAGKLDNSQRALLQIAQQPTPSAQLRLTEEIIERRRAERARHASAAEQKTAGEIAKLKAGLANDKRTVESLEAKIAYKRQQLRALKDAPAADSGDIAIVVTPMTEPSRDQDISGVDPPLDIERLIEQHAAEVENFQDRIRELEEQLSTARQTAPSSLADPAGPATGVGDLAIPPFLERRALSEDEQRQADDLERVWANTWPLVRQRFLAKYAGVSASTSHAPTSSEIH
jgi:ParB-like nuclease domain